MMSYRRLELMGRNEGAIANNSCIGYTCIQTVWVQMFLSELDLDFE